jgi:hypothetical protein
LPVASGLPDSLLQLILGESLAPHEKSFLHADATLSAMFAQAQLL